MGVDTVLCGGIDCWSAQSLQSAGVTIYGWVAGEIDEALAALLRGELDSDVQATTPGRWGCRRFPGDDRTGGRPGRGRGFGPRAGRGRRRDRDEGGTGPPPALRPPR
jgi:predicted Fe-Mo cluster-binding NifX family protein